MLSTAFVQQRMANHQLRTRVSNLRQAATDLMRLRIEQGDQQENADYYSSLAAHLEEENTKLRTKLEQAESEWVDLKLRLMAERHQTRTPLPSDTPAARALQKRLLDVIPTAEALDRERGDVLPPEYTGLYEVRGYGWASYIAQQTWRLQEEIHGPQKSRKE